MNHSRKDPCRYRQEFHTLENLQDFTEALEIVRDFLVADTPQRVRLALIALDNTAELLMAQISRTLFQDDEFRAKVIPPRFSRKTKKEVAEYFGPKTKLMKSEGILSEHEASLLDLAHSYRNRSFHHGHHNSRPMRVLSILMLGPLSKLLENAFGGVSEGGNGEIDWLQRYGVSTKPLEFGPASGQIIARLAGELEVPIYNIVETLCGDITARLADVDLMLQDEWFSLTPERWDEALRHVQFLESFDDDAASAEYRKLTYEITASVRTGNDGAPWSPQPAGKASVEKYARTQSEYETRRAAEMASFKPELQLGELSHLKREIGHIKTAKSESDVVMRYQVLDLRLARMEDLVRGAQRMVDRSTQFAIDLARGK